MKILKVIVDEVPDGCGYCKLEKPKSNAKDAWAVCLVYNKVMACHCYPPPSWCPLTTLDEFQAALDEC